MKLTGTWASYWNDLQLKFTEDGTMALTSLEDGIFDQPTEYTLTDSGFSFLYAGSTVSLTRKDDDTFTGKGIELIRLRTVLPVYTPRTFDRSGTPAGNRDAFIGKWKCSQIFGSCVMDIFPHEEDRVIIRISFPEFRSFGFEPHSYWIDGDTVIWQINDTFNSGRCEVTLTDGHLRGTYTQLGHGDFPAVDFEKVSDEPSMEQDNSPLPLPEDKTRVEILREFAAYGEKADPVVTEYFLNEPLPEEIAALGFEKYVNGKFCEELAYACLDFVCDHWHHNGVSGLRCGRHLMDLVNFADEHDHAVNCRGLSIILAILLRHAGLKAQHVTCLPYEYPFGDCHVVVDCLLPDGKRVMLDPTYRLHFTDDSGNPVSLPALRQHLIDGTAIHPNERAGYNGGTFHLEEYRDYMAKNTLRFSKGIEKRDGTDESPQIMLSPADYPIEKTEPSDQALILHDPDAFWA
ncbi:MAG: transglutaminase domain-containing protein [Clostridia bacterium]|nr:transglutaminase domain-containing protein [Clostridia bacterium]